MVAEKIYSDSEYRKQLLLRVLPKFEKFEQFDELHTDFVTSVEKDEEQEQVMEDKPVGMAVSTGAAQLLRQINFSLGRGDDTSSVIAPATIAQQQQPIVDESLDERMEINTVVENECDNDFDYNYSGGGPSINKGECQSPSVASDDRQIKSFETPSL